MMSYVNKQIENLTIVFALEYMLKNVNAPVQILMAGGLPVILYTSVREVLDSNTDRNNGYHNRGFP
jgi:hypothetical protein